MYPFGYGVNQDFRRAHNSYVQAVEKGSAVAANHLGRIYLNGEGVKADPKTAEKWYKKSVELDLSEENRCKNGQHPDRAFCALLELSQTGNAQAMAAIGEIYLSGITHGQETIVKPDPIQAKNGLKELQKMPTMLRHIGYYIPFAKKN